MAISKVTYAGNTLIDLTGDTVTPENLLSGATAHAANGEEITGIVEDKKGELEAQIEDLRNQIGSLNANIAANTSAIATKSDSTVTDQLAKNTAQIETAGTATSAHSAGEYVMISNALYKVTASVAKGDAWTIGTNVTAANIGSEISSLKSDLANRKAYYAVNMSSVTVENVAIIDGVSLDLPSGNYVIFVGMNYITLQGYPRIVLYFDGTADNTVRTWLSNTVNEQNQLQTAFYVSKSSAFKVQVGSIGSGAKFTASEYIYLIAIKL